MFGEQGFIRRHNVFAVGNRFQHETARRLVTADQFHHDVYIGMRGQLGQIVDDFYATLFQMRRAAGRALAHYRHLNATSRATGDFRLIAFQNFNHARCDGSHACNANFNRFHNTVSFPST